MKAFILTLFTVVFSSCLTVTVVVLPAPPTGIPCDPAPGVPPDNTPESYDWGWEWDDPGSIPLDMPTDTLQFNNFNFKMDSLKSYKYWNFQRLKLSKLKN